MVIINGCICEDQKVILDNGFYFGQGVFETILVKKEPVFLKEHCHRLNRGLRVLGVPASMEEAYLMRYIRHYRIQNCVLKVIVTEKNIVLTTRPVPYKPEDYIKGFAVSLSGLRRNPFSYTTYVKSLNYMDNLREREKAIKKGFNEVLFLNTHGVLAEGSLSNVFLVKDSELLTPSVRCGLLDGIVRRWVIKQYSVTQRICTLDDIRCADEVFLTNSIVGIMKVRRFADSRMYGESPVCTSISEVYWQFVDQHE
jgi:4-amino-4-deoxychorismate lyase